MTPSIPHLTLDPAGASRWRLGQLELDGEALRLSHDGVTVNCDLVQLRMLLALVEAWPAPLDKQALLDRVWGQRDVSEATLHKSMSLLRRQLKSVGEEGWIETRHGLGYQLARAPEPLQTISQAPEASGHDAALRDPPTSNSRPVAAGEKSPRISGPWPVVGALVLLLVAGVLAFTWLQRDPLEALPEIGLPETSSPGSTAAGAAFAELDALDAAALADLAQRQMPADLQLAEAALMRASRGLEPPDDPALAGRLSRLWGMLRFHQGQLHEARDHWQQALPWLQASEQHDDAARTLSNLGVVADELGEPVERAVELFAAALEHWRSDGNLSEQARALNNRAGMLIRAGRRPEAERDLLALDQVAQALGQAEWLARLSLLRADLALASGDPAEEQLLLAWTQAERAGLTSEAAVAAQRLARVKALSGNAEAERQWLQRSRALLSAAGRNAELPILDYALAVSFEQSSDLEQAAAAFQAVLDGAPETFSIALAIDARLGLARLKLNRGEVELARQEIERALRQARVANAGPAEASALIALGFLEIGYGAGAIAALQAEQQARTLLADSLRWDHERNLLSLRALALIASGQFTEASASILLLRNGADQRSSVTDLAQADFLESILSFSSGQFTEGYRLHRQALGRDNHQQAADVEAKPQTYPGASPATENPDAPQPWRLVLAVGLTALMAGFMAGFLLRRTTA